MRGVEGGRGGAMEAVGDREKRELKEREVGGWIERMEERGRKPGESEI